jgi:hypothetical protein
MFLSCLLGVDSQVSLKAGPSGSQMHASMAAGDCVRPLTYLHVDFLMGLLRHVPDQALTGKHASPATAAEQLEAMYSGGAHGSSAPKRVTVVLVDEMDLLITKKQQARLPVSALRFVLRCVHIDRRLARFPLSQERKCSQTSAAQAKVGDSYDKLPVAVMASYSSNIP